MSKEPSITHWKTILASSLVFIGAICFSTKAIMVKLAYRYEIDSLSLLALRMLFALPIYFLIGYFANRNKDKNSYQLTKKDWGYSLLFGVVGYYLASLFDFIGLQYISAGMERLVLFIYPTLVVLISFIFLGKQLNRTIFIALGLTYLGILIAFVEQLSLPNNPQFLLGAFLVFLAALTYAFYIVGSGSILPRIGTLRYTSIAMSAAGISVLIHHALTQQLALFHFHKMVYYYAFLMAVFATVVPSFLISEGIRVIGANQAAIIGSIGPISTIILAYIFLGEGFGWFQILGTMLVIAGVLLISLKNNEQ